jgi:hypothetical protein
MKPVDHIARFVADLRASPDFAPFADQAESALSKADIAADGCDHEAARFAAIEWIVAQPRSVQEKVEALAKLNSQKGEVHIPSLRRFCGW